MNKILLISCIVLGGNIARASAQEVHNLNQANPSSSPQLNAANLNPAFVLSPDDIQARIDDGKKAAEKGKTIDDLLKDSTRKPSWTRGKHNGKGNSTVKFLGLHGNEFSGLSFNAARLYEQPKIDPEIIKNGMFERQIAFVVNLDNEPVEHKSGLLHKGPVVSVSDADPADVQVTKFVLTDDQGHIFEAGPGTAQNGSSTGERNIQGAAKIFSRGTQDENVSVSGNGGYANANGRANAFSTTFVPWSEMHPYYSSSYNVVFDLFDAQGNPFITQSAKKLTLHIITATGEETVEYDLTKKGTTQSF